jgi:hypothetical protein
MKAPRALVLAAAAAVILGMAGMAYAASPSSASIGPSRLSAGWAGKVFSLGSVPLPGLCDHDKCDYFALDVAVSSSYWADHTGSASVSISWGSSADNFDLYVYKGGQLVKSSAQVVSSSEGVTLSSPSGTYVVLVVPVVVTNSGYSGSARFSSQKKPPPPPPPGGGGGGSGGGGGGSGDGSGSGGGSSGSGYPGWYSSRFDAPSSFAPSYYGGGSVYFGPQDRTITSKPIYYGAGSASPGSGSQGSVTQTQPVTLTVPQLPRFVWLLLPLGMIILAAFAYAVLEPEPEAVDEPILEPEWRPWQPSTAPAPIALAGVMLRGATRAGRAVGRSVARAVGRRPRGGRAQA